MHFLIQNPVATAMLALFLAVGCNGGAGEDGWPIENDGETPSDIPAEWQLVEGPYTGTIRFRVDGKHFGYDLAEPSEFRPDVTHFTTDAESWQPVSDSGLGKLVRTANRVAYAETSSARYLVRRTSSEPHAWEIESFRAPRDSSDFSRVDLAAKFDRVPALYAVGGELFAFTWRGTTDHQLYRHVDGPSKDWEQMSPTSADRFLEFPTTFNGDLYLFSKTADNEAKLHVLEPERDKWVAHSVPGNFDGSSYNLSVIPGDRLMSFGKARKAGPNEWRTEILTVREDGRFEVHELRSNRKLERFTLTRLESSLYLTDEMGRLLRIDTRDWSVARTNAGTCPHVRYALGGLWSIGESIVCSGWGAPILRWKPGQSGWQRAKFGLYRPTDLIIQEGVIHDVVEGAIYRYRDRENRWTVDVPPVPHVARSWLFEDNRVAMSRNCILSRDEDEWRLVQNFVSEEKKTLGRCFPVNKDEFADSGSVVPFRDGFAVSLHGLNFPGIRFLERDGSTMTGVPPIREAYDVGAESAVLTSVENRLWVQLPENGRPPGENTMFRLTPDTGWEPFEPALEVPGEPGDHPREFVLTTAPMAANRLWARVSSRVETDDERFPDRLAVWSSSDERFRLLPAPPPGDLEDRQIMKVTNLGALAATDSGIFRWSIEQSEWVEVVGELPISDVTVIDLAADDRRLAVGLQRGRIWQYGLEAVER